MIEGMAAGDDWGLRTVVAYQLGLSRAWRDVRTVYSRVAPAVNELRRWASLPEAERAQWRDWIEAYHRQECRRVAMVLDGHEQGQVDSFLSAVEWEDLPAGLEQALDAVGRHRRGKGVAA